MSASPLQKFNVEVALPNNLPVDMLIQLRRAIADITQEGASVQATLRLSVTCDANTVSPATVKALVARLMHPQREPLTIKSPRLSFKGQGRIVVLAILELGLLGKPFSNADVITQMYGMTEPNRVPSKATVSYVIADLKAAGLLFSPDRRKRHSRASLTLTRGAARRIYMMLQQ